MGHELEHAQEDLEMCQNTLAYLRKWVNLPNDGFLLQ